MVMKKFNQLEFAQKIHANACTPILVGMVFPVLEILLLLNLAKFPFWSMWVELAQKVENSKCIP